MPSTRAAVTWLKRVVALVAVGLACGGVAAETVRVGIYDNLPKVGVDAQGRPQGIFVDVLEAIAQREGWTLRYVPGTWKEGLDRLAAGEIDLMPDVALIGDRATLYDFHREPVLTSWNEVYVRQGGQIRSLLDLQGRRLAVLDGSMQQEYLLNLAAGFDVRFELLRFPDFRAAFDAVRGGAADAVVTNRFYGLRNARAAGLEATAIVFNPSGLYYAAPKGQGASRLAAIDRQLAALKANPSSPYHASQRRWLSEAPGGVAAVPAWVAWVVPVGLIAVASSLGWAVTARRQARRLAASEQRQRDLATELGLIIENSADAICVGDEEGTLLQVSPAAEKLWGWRPEELVGRSYLDLVVPQDREGTARLLAELRERGGRHEQLESRTLRRDGSLAYVLWSVAWSPLQRRWYGIARDDTDRRRLRRELERRAEAMERAAQQLAVARDAAQAADRTKSAFLATMSHELRTPLNSIIGFNGVLLQGLAGPLNDEQKRQLGMVRDSARHLLALINDVLDISKIEAGEIRVVPARFDLRATITRIVGQVDPMARRKGLALRVELDARLHEMNADARRLEQILLNLLSNAVKFTERGEIRLVVDRLESGPDDPASRVRFRVIDTGIGIRAEDMEVLFQPFRQVDSRLSRTHEGTGLGLAISRRLATLMGGTVDASSVWHEGSTFTVTLPLEPAMEATA